MVDMKKKFLALPLMLAIGGCTGRGESASTSLDMMAEASAPVAITKAEQHPRSISVETAIARLPEAAGQPKAARDRHFPNGYWQEMTLDSDVRSMESRIEIAIQNGRPLPSSDKAPVWKPGEIGIRQELARYFATMRMQVVASGDYDNKYGRFGLAIGREGDALRCIYAWQYIDDARRAFADGGRIPLEGATTAPASLRVKLCRSDVTVDDLVGFVRQLNVVIPENFGVAEVVAAPNVSHRSTVSTARKKTSERQRHLAELRDQAALGKYPIAAGGNPSATGGARYLAPIETPVIGANAVGTARGLNPNLPPQAYRGPQAAGQEGLPLQKPNPRSAELTDKGSTATITTRGAPVVLPLNDAVVHPN